MLIFQVKTNPNQTAPHDHLNLRSYFVKFSRRDFGLEQLPFSAKTFIKIRERLAQDATIYRTFDNEKKLDEWTIESIDLRDNNFNEIPSELFDITSLTRLNLANNKLTSVPPDITRLVNLETLDLSNNPIDTLQIQVNKLLKLSTILIGNRKGEKK